MLNMVFQMIMKVILVFTVIAGFDFMYQKWEYEKGIKMTKQEIKEEYKETEGNPEIKRQNKESAAAGGTEKNDAGSAYRGCYCP